MALGPCCLMRVNSVPRKLACSEPDHRAAVAIHASRGPGACSHGHWRRLNSTENSFALWNYTNAQLTREAVNPVHARRSLVCGRQAVTLPPDTFYDVLFSFGPDGTAHGVCSERRQNVWRHDR